MIISRSVRNSSPVLVVEPQHKATRHHQMQLTVFVNTSPKKNGIVRRDSIISRHVTTRVSKGDLHQPTRPLLISDRQILHRGTRMRTQEITPAIGQIPVASARLHRDSKRGKSESVLRPSSPLRHSRPLELVMTGLSMATTRSQRPNSE